MWRIHNADTDEPLTKVFMHHPERVVRRLLDLMAACRHGSKACECCPDYYIGDSEGRPVPLSKLAPLAQLSKRLAS